MNLYAFPKLNGDPIYHNIDLFYEGNTVVISLYPIDMAMVERLLKAGANDKFGVTIGGSRNEVSLGHIQRAKLTKVDSALDEITQIEITITLSE